SVCIDMEAHDHSSCDLDTIRAAAALVLASCMTGHANRDLHSFQDNAAAGIVHRGMGAVHRWLIASKMPNVTKPPVSSPFLQRPNLPIALAVPGRQTSGRRIASTACAGSRSRQGQIGYD